MKPLVSVIVVNWNGGDVFKKCLKTLSQMDYPNWELIIVDNASSDNSDREYKNYKKLAKITKLIKNKLNVGFAPANNQALAYCKGQYLLLLNNDTTVPPTLLDRLVQKMESDKTLGVIQPKIYIMDKNKHLDNAGSFLTKIGFLSHWGFLEKDSKKYSLEKEIFSAKGACFLTRQELVKKIGLFDKDYFSYFEESDFCWRVWLIGFRVIYYPEVSIKHKLGFTIKRVGVSDLNYHYYKNRICSLLKNLNTLNLFVILPIHLTISLGIASVFALRGSFENSTLILRAISWNVVNLNETLRKRMKVQSTRVVSDADIFSKVGRRVNWKKFFNDFKRVEADIKTSKA